MGILRILLYNYIPFRERGSPGLGIGRLFACPLNEHKM
jgi:hypothetical protein